MILVSVTHKFLSEGWVNTGFGRGYSYDIEQSILVQAHVEQDSGEGFASELCIVWTDGTLDRIEEMGLGCEQIEGCLESIESAFWAHEEEMCRVSKVRQRTEVAA